MGAMKAIHTKCALYLAVDAACCDEEPHRAVRTTAEEVLGDPLHAEVEQIVAEIEKRPDELTYNRLRFKLLDWVRSSFGLSYDEIGDFYAGL